MNRRTFLRCVPAVPAAAAAIAASPADALQAALVEPDDDEREVIDYCESCNRKLYEGDNVFRYSDGPTFCEAHAPTWNDLKAMQDEQIADGTWTDNFEEPEHAKEAIDQVVAEIFGGHGDEKYVWPL